MELFFSFQKEFLLEDKEPLANHKRGIDAQLLAALPKGEASRWLTSVQGVQVLCDLTFLEEAPTLTPSSALLCAPCCLFQESTSKDVSCCMVRPHLPTGSLLSL